MLKVADLSLFTDKKVLMKCFNCHISSGECWVVLGKNGVGKTTFIRTLAGLRRVDQGEIRLKDQLIRDLDMLTLAKMRAYLSQNQRDAFSYKVLQVVLAGRYPYAFQQYWETEADLKAACFAMEQFNVFDLKDRDIRTLSGGERQRVALASVFAQDTPLLFLDEPVSALDLAHQKALMQLIQKMTKEQGKTVVMVLHDLNLAHDVVTHAVLMHEGGDWKAGKSSDMLQSDLLSSCLGYPIVSMQHQNRTIYIPA